MIFKIKLLAMSLIVYSNGPALGLHPDTGLNTVEMIQRHGYPLERHTDIQTEDGYLLEIQRIPYGINSKSTKTGIPVLFIHGLTCSSADWINVGVERSLPYALADMGFDVWLGNIRGTVWSRKHITLDPVKDKEQFWNFSFHESGIYDLPAIIDHILKENGAKQLFYIGHSQGSTLFVVMASERPEYNNKIKMMTSLGPNIYMKHVDNILLQVMAEYYETIEFLVHYIGIYEFLPNSQWGEMIGKYICADEALLQGVCKTVYSFFCGYDFDQLNLSLLSVIVTNLPAGSSTKQFVHIAQGIKYDTFRQYDYLSAEANLAHYGQPTPPEYDFTKITTPIAVYYAQNDGLSAAVDVEKFIERLPNLIFSHKIEYEAFNHGDFLWANDVFDLLYNDVIATITKYMT